MTAVSSRPNVIYTMLLALPLAAAITLYVGRASLEWNLCIAATSVVCLVYWLTRGGHKSPASDSIVTALAIAAPAYVAFQLVPLPLPLLRLIAHRRAELTEALGSVMPTPFFAPISVDVEATIVALMTTLACVLCFLTIRQLTWSSLRRASWLPILPLVVIAVFQSGFALWQAWKGEDIAGTYWNRNHLAGLLEMVLPLTVAYAVFGMRRNAGVLLPSAAGVLMFLGVVASGSKLGFVSTLAGLSVLGFVSAFTLLSGRARWATLAAIPVLGVLAFTLLANQQVLVTIERLIESGDGLRGEGRLPIWIDTLRLFAAHPFFGSGLGAYSTSFLAYQTVGLDNHWAHAHNDYLELATDLGAVGLTIFIALLVVVVRRAFGLTRPSRRSGSDLLALGCIGSIAAISLHSLGDFNLYVPGNAMLLAWIAGIAAGVPEPRRETVGSQAPNFVEAAPHTNGRWAWPQSRRWVPVGLGVVAIAMSSAAIARGSGADVAADSPVSLDERRARLRHNPVSPFLWLDMADGQAAIGQFDEATKSVTSALTLGGRVPPVIRRAATLLDSLGERRRAVTVMSRELAEAGSDPAAVFNWFAERRVPNDDVIAGLSKNQGALAQYLKYLMLPGTCPEAGQAWQVLLPHRPEPRLASEYVNFLIRDCLRPDEAIRAWTGYAKLMAPEYQVNNWVFNGGFESDPAPVQFDWRWTARGREVDAALDHQQKQSGARSLRMVFRGSSAAAHEGAWQIVPVTPGTYRFSAAVRTSQLTSKDGIRFRISGAVAGTRVDVLTEPVTGTTEWRMVMADVVVPEGFTSIRIQVVRRPGPAAKAEGDLSGTIWVDAVTLTKVG